MNKTIVVGLAATVALSSTWGLGAPAGADSPPSDADRGPVTRAAGWLVGQVPESGLLHVYYEYVDENGDLQSGDYDDVGLTIDGARALAETGGHGPTVSRMTAAVESAMPGYYAGSANAAGKAASFLLERSPASTSTDDAVAAVRSTVSSTTPIVGRIEDPGSFDFASPLGQAFAVDALADAQAPELTAARDFLLAQQCESGYFRGSFTTDKAVADQSCDSAPSGQRGSSVDTTATTVLALQDLAATDPAVASALDDATSWLATVQGPDGSFTNSGSAGAGNANSTGLAGWALGAEGDAESAADAAAWLRDHQLTNAGSCAPYDPADNGAVVVDDLGRSNALNGFDAIDRSVAARATAQALSALAFARGGPLGAGRTRLAFPGGYAKAGTNQRVVIHGAPGNRLCVKAGTATPRFVVVGPGGSTSITVRLPVGTKKTVVSAIDGSNRAARTEIVGLGATRLRVAAPTSAKQARKALVRATGLRAGEGAKILFRGKVVAKGKAGANGAIQKRFTVTGRVGKAKVVVVGQFSDRRGAATVTVTR